MLRLIAQGKSNREIAAELHIAENTAGNHVERCVHQLGINNRTPASLAAADYGLSGLPGATIARP